MKHEISNRSKKKTRVPWSKKKIHQNYSKSVSIFKNKKFDPPSGSRREIRLIPLQLRATTVNHRVRLLTDPGAVAAYIRERLDTTVPRFSIIWMHGLWAEDTQKRNIFPPTPLPPIAYLASVTKVSSGSRYILAGGPRFRWRALILSTKGKWTFLPFIHDDGDGVSRVPSAILYISRAHYSLLPSRTPNQHAYLAI